MDQDNNNAATLLAAGAASTQSAIDVGGVPVKMVPEGYTLVSLEQYLQQPTRRRSITTFNDAASFIAYVVAMKTDATRLYSQAEPPAFMAIFNDDTQAAAGWGDDKASYACPVSAEWKAWKASTGKQMAQDDFAQFIHRNNVDCIQPPAADMLEISRDLTAKKKVDFASSIVLANGTVQFTYNEEIQGATTKGQLTVPEQFVIGIPVLEGGDVYSVVCDLRYRISDQGKLVMWYDLVRPHKIVEDAFRTVRDLISTGTDLKILNGQRHR